MSFEDYLNTINNGRNLSRMQAAEFLGFILDDATLDDAKIAEVITSLTKKKATVDEISGFVDSMRARMIHVETAADAIDVCGTGGDKAGTFNISTAAAILLAAGDVSVAKHGNRAATSKCGSADVLEELGVPVDLAPETAVSYLAEHKFVFLFAPLYHPSLKKLAIVRKQLGFPTVFNLLGPLLNPADVRRQVIGTFSVENAKLLADVVAQMNYQHVIVLFSEDGLDEASLIAPVQAFEVKREVITPLSLNADDYGLAPAPLSEIKGGDPSENAKMIINDLQPADALDAHKRIIVFNAGLGFYVSGKASSISDGIKLAIDTLNGGAASAKLKELMSNE